MSTNEKNARQVVTHRAGETDGHRRADRMEAIQFTRPRRVSDSMDGTPAGPDRCDCGQSMPTPGNEGYCDRCSGWQPWPMAACSGCQQFLSVDDLVDGRCDQCVQEAAMARASKVVSYAHQTAPWGALTRVDP